MAAAEDDAKERMARRVPPPVPGDSEDHIRIGMDGQSDTAPSIVLHSSRWTELVPCAVIVSDFRVVIIPHDPRKPTLQAPMLALENSPDLKQADGKWTKDMGAGHPVFVCDLVLKMPFTWTLAFRFSQRREGEALVKRIGFVRETFMSKLSSMFAFAHAEQYRREHAGEELEDGWQLYDVERELERQVGPVPDDATPKGVGKNLRPWYRIAQLEPKGESGVSPTYPNRFAVPIEATDKLLTAISQFRSRGRLPMVSYVHLATGASISRASQPLTGVKGKRCDADEIMLESLLPSAYKVGGTPIPACYSDFSRTGTTKDVGDAGDSPKQAGVTPVARPPPLTGRPPPLAGRPAMRPPPSLTGGSASPPAEASPRTESPPPDSGKERKGRIVIFDARSQKAAVANAAGRGGGYEDISRNYKSGRIFFLDMGNVHAVRRSWEDIRKEVRNHNNNISSMHNKDLVPGNDNTNHRFLKNWANTDWILHCQRLIWGANRIVSEILAGNSALVHCSDGWDRTAQLTSTAMLLIDPFYRTVRGFAVLIEKEWLAAGHKFAERCGHQVSGTMQRSPLATGDDEADDEDSGARDGIAKHTRHGKSQESSPIFPQWLDAVHQLLQQFPCAFEFTPALLEYIMWCMFSGQFGTFLCNFDKEREGEGLKTKTVSIWTEVLRIVHLEKTGRASEVGDRRFCKRFVNPLYRESDQRVLRPSASTKRLGIWESLYLRYDFEQANCDKCPSEIMVQNCARWRDEVVRLRAMLRDATAAGAAREDLGVAMESEDDSYADDCSAGSGARSPRMLSNPPVAAAPEQAPEQPKRGAKDPFAGLLDSSDDD